MPKAAGIHYFLHNGGSATRPPLVLIHGAGGDHLSWPAEARRLPDATVFTLDLPGHGSSEGHGRQSVEDYACSVIDFLNEVGANLEQQGKNHSFRTHKIGVTGFSRQGKGFMFVNLRQSFVAILYFTGKGNIPGLEKRNWLNKDDNMGSETYKITDDAAIKKAVGFALAAWDLAS